MNPLLTITVPCYNVEQWLDQTLASMAEARFEGRLEVLIINDGSTDHTEAIAQNYVSAFPQIFRLISKENGGHGSGINTGIREASGTYFRVVDGDDWVDPDALDALLTFLEKASADLVIDQKCEHNITTGLSEVFLLPQALKSVSAASWESLCRDPEVCSYVMLHTLSVRTDLLRSSGVRVLEHVFYEDIEYIIKSTASASSAAVFPGVIYQYRVGNAAQSVYYANYVRRFDHHEKVTEEMIRFAEAFEGESWRKDYVYYRVRLLIHTHLKIALIYDEDRGRGAKRASEFRGRLKKSSPLLWKKTRKRALIASALHCLGVDYSRLEWLQGKLGR